MREADRPMDQRVSVLDRAPTGSNALPERAQFGHLDGVDVASIRLALSLDDHRVYVGLAAPDERLFLCVENPASASSSIGPRTALVTHGALVQGSTYERGFMTVGIVADAVTAVRVGEAEAVLGSNVFLAETRSADQVFVTSGDGERAVMTPIVLRRWRNT
jgi:hypothetical protein